MAHVRVEMDRGNGWEVRSEGDTDATRDQIAAALPAYAIQYPHRALIGGQIVATVAPKRRRHVAN